MATVMDPALYPLEYEPTVHLVLDPWGNVVQKWAAYTPMSTAVPVFPGSPLGPSRLEVVKEYHPEYDRWRRLSTIPPGCAVEGG